MLSPACRERMLLSIDREAPADVLEEIRALARRKEHDGISAWRAYREKQQQQQQNGVSVGSGSMQASSILKPTPSPAAAPFGSRR